MRVGAGIRRGSLRAGRDAVTPTSPEDALAGGRGRSRNRLPVESPSNDVAPRGILDLLTGERLATQKALSALVVAAHAPDSLNRIRGLRTRLTDLDRTIELVGRR